MVQPRGFYPSGDIQWRPHSFYFVEWHRPFWNAGYFMICLITNSKHVENVQHLCNLVMVCCRWSWYGCATCVIWRGQRDFDWRPLDCFSCLHILRDQAESLCEPKCLLCIPCHLGQLPSDLSGWNFHGLPLVCVACFQSLQLVWYSLNIFFIAYNILGHISEELVNLIRPLWKAVSNFRPLLMLDLFYYSEGTSFTFKYKKPVILLQTNCLLSSLAFHRTIVQKIASLYSCFSICSHMGLMERQPGH